MNVDNTSAIKSSVGNFTTSIGQNIYVIENLTLIIKSIICTNTDVIMYIILGKHRGKTSVLETGKKQNQNTYTNYPSFITISVLIISQK